MKILFVISQLGGGGAEKVVSLLSGSFSEMGHTVSLITLLSCPIVYPLNPKVKLLELNAPNSRIFGTIQQIKALRKKYREIQPDIIISFLPVVNMTAICANFGLPYKIILSERNDPYQNPRKKAVRLMRNFLYRFADGFVFQTPDAKAYFKKYGKRGAVIANPLAQDLPMPYTGQRSKRLVTAVRLEKQKNLELLIRAFAMLHRDHPEYTLEIYGSGPEKTAISLQIAQQNLKESVFLKGFSKHLHQDIADAAAFVLPSDYEGMSNSMLEALALGIPVISTDHPIGGAKMFIKSFQNGILTRVNNEEELYRAMEYAVEHPDAMKQMAFNAIAIRDNLSLNSITAQWMEYIQKIE